MEYLRSTTVGPKPEDSKASSSSAREWFARVSARIVVRAIPVLQRKTASANERGEWMVTPSNARP